MFIEPDYPIMTPDEIQEILNHKMMVLGGYPGVDGLPQRYMGFGHERYSEALSHVAIGIMLSCKPTHRSSNGLWITDILWPQRIQWDALHIYRVFAKVATQYDLYYDLSPNGHIMFAGDHSEYRIYFRVAKESIFEKFADAYLIPDWRALRKTVRP